MSGLLYTIPTLAFLALLIPVVGLGRANAIICMVAFSLMILIRNIATGIREVPGDVVEAAQRHGNERGRDPARGRAAAGAAGHRRRTADRAVTVISVAVVAAYVNAGGLGTLIFSGISSDHAPKIWAGALTACALAVVADLGLSRARAAAAPARGIEAASMLLVEAWQFISRIRSAS